METTMLVWQPWGEPAFVDVSFPLFRSLQVWGLTTELIVIYFFSMIEMLIIQLEMMGRVPI